jgi:hypothetical protein
VGILVTKAVATTKVVSIFYNIYQLGHTSDTSLSLSLSLFALLFVRDIAIPLRKIFSTFSCPDTIWSFSGAFRHSSQPVHESLSLSLSLSRWAFLASSKWFSLKAYGFNQAWSYGGLTP